MKRGSSMKIAINILPLQTGHKNRGIGYYTKNLVSELEKDNSLEIIKFTNIKELKSPVDVVHYPWFDPFSHSLPLRCRYPLVVSVHDCVPLVFPDQYPVGIKGKLNNFLQRQSLKRCKYIITDSQFSKKDVIRLLQVKEEKVIVAPLAAGEQFHVLSDAQLIHARRKYGLPDNFLLYVGDANWVKNLPFLIQGFNRLIRTEKFKNHKLVLANGVFLKNVENINHPELASLKKVNNLIRDNHLEGFIIKPGFLDTGDLVAFYNLATVYTQPSLYEGFGLPVLEAMACGTPVICSNAASLPEVGGEAVIYFDPKNLDRFVNILIEVLENKSLQYKLSKLGLAQVQKFSWEKTAKETKAVYQKAVKI